MNNLLCRCSDTSEFIHFLRVTAVIDFLLLCSAIAADQQCCESKMSFPKGIVKYLTSHCIISHKHSTLKRYKVHIHSTLLISMTLSWSLQKSASVFNNGEIYSV